MKPWWPPAAPNPANMKGGVRSQRTIRASLASVLKDGKVNINVYRHLCSYSNYVFLIASGKVTQFCHVFPREESMFWCAELHCKNGTFQLKIQFQMCVFISKMRKRICCTPKLPFISAFLQVHPFLNVNTSTFCLHLMSWIILLCRGVGLVFMCIYVV